MSDVKVTVFSSKDQSVSITGKITEEAIRELKEMHGVDGVEALRKALQREVDKEYDRLYPRQ